MNHSDRKLGGVLVLNHDRGRKRTAASVFLDPESL